MKYYKKKRAITFIVSLLLIIAFATNSLGVAFASSDTENGKQIQETVQKDDETNFTEESEADTSANSDQQNQESTTDEGESSDSSTAAEQDSTDVINENDTESNSDEDTSSDADMTNLIQPFSLEQPDLATFTVGETKLAHDARSISVQKTWQGDQQEDRPESVTFELYQENSTEPIATLIMTEEDSLDSNSSIWKGTFDREFPIYDENGKEITYTVKEAEINGYRSVQNGVDTSTSEGYQNVSVYVPVQEIRDGEDYLVSSGIEGNVSLYRAEFTQTDGILSTEEGMVQAITSGRPIDESKDDGTYVTHTDYLLIADEYIDGENTTDYMTWRAMTNSNGDAILSSGACRLWGEKEDNNPNKYPAYLSTEKNKNDGLCVYKTSITDFSQAPDHTIFSYDELSGGFKTAGSDKVIYLYKKIDLRDGTFRTASSNYRFTNWKNVSDTDPLDKYEEEPKSYTNIAVDKKWTDGNENHINDSVTVILKANDIQVKELVLNSANEWKDNFEGLPLYDDSGEEIKYTIEEKSATDADGTQLSYVPQIEENESTNEAVWLPVDRPTKSSGGDEYIVIAFPNNKNEIGQDIWDDGDNNGVANRTALTANDAGTKFALGSKNSNNTDGASMDVTVTEGPLTVDGKTYTNYIKDSEAHNSDGSVRNNIIWQVEFQQQGTKSDYGPWIRDLFSFKALAGAGGYLSTQGAMTTENKLDTGNNSRTLFAYGMVCNPNWGEYSSMTSQGYTEDQLTHMVGAMDHYAIRTDKSPGKFGEKDCTYPAFYLYKKVETVNKSYTLTNSPVDKVRISVNKIWDDENNNDNLRPESLQVELIKNGWNTGKYISLSEENNWTYAFENLDKTDVNGNSIEYSVKEHITNSDWYETKYTVEQDGNGNYTIEINNKLKETVKPIVMPETGSRGHLVLLLLGSWLLLAGVLLIIITINYRRGCE